MKLTTGQLVWSALLFAAIAATLYLFAENGDHRTWISSAEKEIVQKDFIGPKGAYCGEVGHETSGFRRFYAHSARDVAYEGAAKFNLTAYAASCGMQLTAQEAKSEEARTRAMDEYAAAGPARMQREAQRMRWLQENAEALRSMEHATKRAREDEWSAAYDQAAKAAEVRREQAR